MANFPFFSNTLPGVYGPIYYPFKKINGGYFIKGYGAEFSGSVKEITKEIIRLLVFAPETGNRKYFIGPFSIYFNPDPTVLICMNPEYDPPDLDTKSISIEFTGEIRKYLRSTIANGVVTPEVTMASFPFNTHTLPSADPPYPLYIKKDGVTLIETDNCGIAFSIIGDKHLAAVAYVEHALDEIKRVSNASFSTRVGPIRFVVEDKNIVKIEPYYMEEMKYCSWTPETRPEVLEMIELVKSAHISMMKMKAFW